MSVKIKTPAPPKPGGRGEVAPSPRIAGLILIVAGILLMALSGWAPMPSGFAVWENASSKTAPAESPSIVSGGAGDDDLYGEAGSDAIVARGATTSSRRRTARKTT
ncbi:hypothetical protein BH20ACT10_BH20ACT10_03630 [soil metagenome]